MIDEAHRQFLLAQAGANRIRHGRRTLYAHLTGTHDLLEAWGAEQPVRVAGLFHSIYGTKHFHHRAWPLDDRASIQSLIGLEAEDLAHQFCRADRPRALFDSISPRELREIEAANLVEQDSRSRWLQRLLDSDISDAAKTAIAQHLRGDA